MEAGATATHPTDASAPDDAFAQHPEIFVGAALLGGLVLAQVLKRLGSDD
jgi:hypothetical protein